VLRAREEAKFLRRWEVCDRLKEIADQTNNPALRRRAEELDARASALYQKRTANLPASQVLFESDQKTLEKHLGVGQGVQGPAHSSSIITVPGDNSRTADKEKGR
jgi:hypothetical protein